MTEMTEIAEMEMTARRKKAFEELEKKFATLTEMAA